MATFVEPGVVLVVLEVALVVLEVVLLVLEVILLGGLFPISKNFQTARFSTLS